MFYSYDVLNMRTGKLAIVWLAATGRIKYRPNKKYESREIMGTIIYKVCDDILRHINVQDRGLISSLEEYPKRFSLYLSTMLMYGTVRIYNYQVAHLLDDVSIAFSKLLTGPKLAREILGTTPRTTKSANINLADAPNFDPLLFGTALEGDLDLFLTHLDDTDFITPRKIDKDEKQQKSSASRKRKNGSQSEIEVMRQKVPTCESSGLVQGKMDLLLQDWEEPSAPHHHIDATSITLLEDMPINIELMPNEFKTHLEEDDLGPPFDQFPQGFFEPSEKISVQNVTEAVESLVEHPQCLETIPGVEVQATETLPMEEDIGTLPPIAETPADQLVTIRKSPLKNKKDKKRKIAPEEEITIAEVQAPQIQEIGAHTFDETPRIPRREPEIESQLEIELQSLSTTREKKRPKLKRKHPFMDNFTQISSDNLKNQMSDYSDTMRESDFYKDVLYVKWWKNMIPVNQLFCYPRKKILSTELSYLFIRCYHTAIEDVEQHDLEYRSSKGARRELDFHDSASEKGRSPAIFGESSAIGDISSVIHDVSSKHSSSVDKSYQSISITAAPGTSFKELPTIFPLPAVPESAVEFPIPEVVIMPTIDTETSKHPKVGKPVADKEFVIEPPSKRQKSTRIEEVREFTIETEAEVHPQPGSAEFTHRSRRPASPDFGFINMSVVAEIHDPPRDTVLLGKSHMIDVCEPLPKPSNIHSEFIQAEEQVEFQEIGLGPMKGEEQFIPRSLSPIIAVAPHQIVATPESKGQRHLSVLLKFDTLKKTKTSSQLKLTDFLSTNASRSDVASMFADLLDLHKKKKVYLSQKEFYGEIIVNKLNH